MVMVRRELKILDETGLPEKNWKNENVTKMDFQKKTGKMKLRRKRSWQDLKKKSRL